MRVKRRSIASKQGRGWRSAGRLDAIATAPINKEALKLAGSPFPGHTEMLTSLCGASDSLMCFFAGDLRVILLTIHMSLSDAIKAITKERVARALVLADRELKRFGVVSPRIAVAGLNPHAGEHGLFGSEEEREIEPAITECRARHGVKASGPFPADTLFVRAARGEFDAVVACYHDQGLIAVKCMAFGEAVNVTLGLPIIRTSVDHGTAFDIAGRGVGRRGQHDRGDKARRSIGRMLDLVERLSTQTYSWRCDENCPYYFDYRLRRAGPCRPGRTISLSCRTKNICAIFDS